jgi:uncharacterized protein (TIGR00369 family)
MSGLDYLHAVKEGRIPPPPIWRLVNCRLVKIDRGYVIFEITPAEYHYNRFGRVQGGILCTVLDAAMACALSSALPPGMSFTSPELKVNYFRPITIETGLMRCESSVTHKGNRIAVLEAKMLDGTGRLYTHAMSTFMIFEVAKEGAGGL